ncbi:Uncharacterized protein OBRU01_03508 [Operophtera brumata]|uniref:Protein HIRA-like C-terminal domain-containing protein n=1 Tax=Operophtera brumata TaxID=104452 RepID=A0A0L7LH31_OPEBR|nr:Uncharacterized protein OBRU01_03508 [Operophtera brumata]
MISLSNGKAYIYCKKLCSCWLEAKVASCLHLQLSKDYRHWITSLFEHLVNHGSEDQLRAILDDMLGPSHCTSTPKKWQNLILLRWQRMYSEYNDQLNDLKTTSVMNGH